MWCPLRQLSPGLPEKHQWSSPGVPRAACPPKPASAGQLQSPSDSAELRVGLRADKQNQAISGSGLPNELC